MESMEGDHAQENGVHVFEVVHSEVEAYNMYCAYASKVGFSVRREHLVVWPGTSILRLREYRCSRAGLKRPDKVPSSHFKFRRLQTRTNCQAAIVFKADKEGRNLTVSKFVEEHNHPLASQNEQHLLRSHRNVGMESGTILKSMAEAGIRTSDAYCFLADEVGGCQNLGFTKSDVYNFIDKHRRSKIDGGDAANLLELLKERQVSDNMFSFDVQVDDINRLTNFFWIDGLGKIDYECFGDVVIFDTTYRMNKYNLACAPFVAANHHWQNVVIAFAFISEESIESFVWLFKTFLKFVSCKQPVTIFTDQDQAMAVAIQRVFSGSRHRLCQWHIAKKAPSKVHLFNTESIIRALFYQCMSKCNTIEEFEECWSQMIAQGNLQDNRCLNDLYIIKQKWSTAFNKGVLSHGILSTQRSESTNNVCHAITKCTSSLVDCFIQLEKMISNARDKEKEEDFKCKQGSIYVDVRNCPILRQVSKIYTRSMYNKFYDDFKEGAFSLFVEEERIVAENMFTYIIRWCNQAEQNRQWNVEFDGITYDIHCSCYKFESTGLLCSHALKVYTHKNLKSIPEKYILKRWTSNAKKNIYSYDYSINDNSSSTLAFRNHICRSAYNLALRAEKNNELRKYIIDAIGEISNYVEVCLNNSNPTNISTTRKKATIKDPPYFGK